MFYVQLNNSTCGLTHTPAKPLPFKRVGYITGTPLLISKAMQWLVPSTWLMGAPFQHTSDITEHCHCTHVKQPHWSLSRKHFHKQCCCYTDCDDILAPYISLWMVPSLVNEMVLEAQAMCSHYPEAVWLWYALSDCVCTIPSFKWSLFDKSWSHISKFKVTFYININPIFLWQKPCSISTYLISIQLFQWL